MTRRVQTPAKRCATCDREFQRRPNEPAHRFACRLYCEPACRQVARRDDSTAVAASTVRRCEREECAEVLVRRTAGKTPERGRDFARRRFCGPECRVAFIVAARVVAS